jgi:hypothetical protein
MRALSLLAVGFVAVVPLRAAEPIDRTLQKAFPGTQVDRAPVKLVATGQQLVVAGSTLQILADGRFRMNDCFIARLGAGDDSPKVVSSVRSESVTFKPERVVKAIEDLKGNRFVSAELADGSVLLLETK